MREGAEQNVNRSVDLGGVSWRARFASHPAQTASLLCVAVQALFHSDKVTLTRIGATSVGKFINALPMPVLLIDRDLRVAFANRACRRVAPDSGNMVGCYVKKMFPDEFAAQGFIHLMEGIFVHRKPLIAETTIRMGTNEIQGRLHVHAVKIGRKTLLLTIVEDLPPRERLTITGKAPENNALLARGNLNLLDELIDKEVASSERIERALQARLGTSIAPNRTMHTHKRPTHYPFNATADAIVICDLRGRVMYANDSFSRFFGGIIPAPPRQEIAFLTESSYETMVSKVLSWIDESVSHEQFQTQHLARDGSAVTVQVSASRFTDYEGKPAGMMFLLQDEALHKRIEEAVRRSEESTCTLLNASEDAIVIVDTEGIVLSANEVFAGRVGLSIDRFIGRNLVDFFPEHLAQHRKDRGNEAIETGKAVRFSDIRNGRHLENIVCPLFDRNGKVERLAVVSRDITDQLQKVDELQTGKDAAELANRAKNEFLANVSHELRTPLNAIIGFSEILEDQLFGELNDKQKAYVGHVLSSGRKLLQLINNILDLSSVESGEMELCVAGVNIRKLLESCMLLISERAQKRGLDVQLQVTEELNDVHIEADQTKLNQIVFNLLSNAAKFTPPGGKILVRADKRGDEVIVSISDTGIGLKPEHQERVFDAFEQVDSSHTRRHPGTGLGLALARKLVELHGGRIWVESPGEGLGSTFGFAIPVSAPLPQVAQMR